MTKSTRSPLPGVLAFGLVAALLALPSSPASAVPTWSAPIPLSAAKSSAVDVAVAPDGTATAVWHMAVETRSVVMASTRAPGGAWSEPVPISAEDLFAIRPAVVVDANGEATVVWRVLAAPTDLVQAAHRSAAGVWSEPVQLSDKVASEPSAAVDAAGVVTAVWLRLDDVDSKRRVRTRTWTAGGGWGAPLDLSAAGQNADDPRVAVDADGRATAAWIRFNGSVSVVQASSRAVGGGWEIPDDLSDATNSAGAPQVASAAGEAVVVWIGTGTANVAWVSSRQAGGAWSDPDDLSPLDKNSISPTVAVDESGNATAAWSTDFSGTYRVQGAHRPPGGTWTSEGDLSAPNGGVGNVNVVLDGAGAATVVWNRYNGSKNVVEATRKALGGTWSEPDVLSDPTLNSFVMTLAIDSAGDVLAGWESAVAATTMVQAASLDVAGPALTAFSKPAKATAGKAASFKATALDTWSSVATYAWRFGDGKSASGASTSHKYAKTGKYTVTLTVTDSVGNTTVRKAAVTVVAPKPVMRIFELVDASIRKSEATKLRVKLNTKATLKLVLKGKNHGQRVVLKRKLLKGITAVTIKGQGLRPDTYVVTGTATNSTGTSKKKTVILRVVR